MQSQILQIAPNGVKPIIRASQFDAGRQFLLVLFDGSASYNPPAGTTLRIEGKKPDGNVFSYSNNLTLSGNIITVTTVDQMTVVAGTVQCEIRLSLNGNDIGTVNFELIVEESPITGGDISDTEIPAIIQLARAEMENAEAWAVGERGGVPVPSTDPTYQNNAKYYAQMNLGMVSDQQYSDIATILSIN